MARTMEEREGGTPPPHFLQTNTPSPARKRGGQPGNDNALKHGRRTAQMAALRTEVRFAVLKARALAKIAWNSEVWPKGREGKSAFGEAGAGLKSLFRGRSAAPTGKAGISQ